MTFCICVCIWPEKRVRHSLHRRSVPLVCSQNSDATFSTTGGWALLYCVVFKLFCLEPSRQDSWTAVFSFTFSSAGGCCVVLCSTQSVLVCLSSAGGCWTAVATIPSIKRYAARLLSGFNTIFLWLTAGSMDPGISTYLSTLFIMSTKHQHLD